MFHIGDTVLVRADFDTDENEIIWQYSGQMFTISGVMLDNDHFVYVLDEDAHLYAEESDLYKVVA